MKKKTLWDGGESRRRAASRGMVRWMKSSVSSTSRHRYQVKTVASGDSPDTYNVGMSTRPTMTLLGLLHLVSLPHMVSADRCSVSMVLAMMEARQGSHWNDDGEQTEQEIKPVLASKYNRSRGLIDSGTENG